ncbi:MAG: dienelactone hydrolase family protein [Myxococcota bacterium]
MNFEFPSGPDSIRGALYLPEQTDPRPGVVVIPDVRGLHDHYHDVARRLARDGFVALALDLYSREGPPDLPDMETVFRFMRELPDSRVLQDIGQAIDALSKHPSVGQSRVGITGFCMGGMYTILAACTCKGLSAAVSWYGMLRVQEIDESSPEHPLEALPRLSCPLLGLFGKEDPIVPLGDVEELQREGASQSHEVEVVVYPGAGHAFANDTRPDAYRADAAEDAWSRALAFLHRYLD